MYDIYILSSKYRKRFQKFVKETTDENGKCQLLDILNNYPKGNQVTHGKISKKGSYWNYDLSEGDRITYKVYDDKNAVIICCIGNHNEYMTFLRTHGKQKN